STDVSPAAGLPAGGSRKPVVRKGHGRRRAPASHGYPQPRDHPDLADGIGAFRSELELLHRPALVLGQNSPGDRPVRPARLSDRPRQEDCRRTKASGAETTENAQRNPYGSGDSGRDSGGGAALRPLRRFRSVATEAFT